MDLHRYIALFLTLWVFAIHGLKFLSCQFFLPATQMEDGLDREGQGFLRPLDSWGWTLVFLVLEIFSDGEAIFLNPGVILSQLLNDFCRDIFFLAMFIAVAGSHLF